MIGRQVFADLLVRLRLPGFSPRPAGHRYMVLPWLLTEILTPARAAAFRALDSMDSAQYSFGNFILNTLSSGTGITSRITESQ